MATAAQYQGVGRGRARQRRAALTLGAGLSPAHRVVAKRCAAQIFASRLKASLAHIELAVVETREDALRPRFVCRVVHRAAHAPFAGFNRAQAAVIEGAVLVSRLHLLPRAEVEAEMKRLAVVVGKTAGENETEAWGWLVEKAARFVSAETEGAQDGRHPGH